MERIDLTVSLDSAPTKGGDGEYLTRAEVVDYTPSPRRPTKCIFLKEHPVV